jgi:hypothetical protein
VTRSCAYSLRVGLEYLLRLQLRKVRGGSDCACLSSWKRTWLLFRGRNVCEVTAEKIYCLEEIEALVSTANVSVIVSGP